MTRPDAPSEPRPAAGGELATRPNGGATEPTDEELRALLPAVEPDRTLDDWGRSERVESLFDRTVADFLYRLWFRCEVEGIENVPRSGGALVVSNHSGALPPDAAMIAKAIKEEHPRGRPLHITVEHFFKGYPGFSTRPTSTASSRTSRSSSSSSPKGARGPRSSTRTATG
jgi:hypothetical protein